MQSSGPASSIAAARSRIYRDAGLNSANKASEPSNGAWQVYLTMLVCVGQQRSSRTRQTHAMICQMGMAFCRPSAMDRAWLNLDNTLMTLGLMSAEGHLKLARPRGWFCSVDGFEEALAKVSARQTCEC